MGEQGVTDIRRITVRRDGILKPTNTFVLTFNTPILPTVVKIGFIQVKVDVYIPNPLQCYNCQVFGHHKTSMVDLLYAATVLNLNIAHLVSVINLTNVSTGQVTTLLTLNNAHSRKKRSKY